MKCNYLIDVIEMSQDHIDQFKWFVWIFYIKSYLDVSYLDRLLCGNFILLNICSSWIRLMTKLTEVCALFFRHLEEKKNTVTIYLLALNPGHMIRIS